MKQVSSNLTLVLVIFLPTFWLAFFGLFTVVVLVSEQTYFGNYPAFIFKIGVALFFLIGGVTLYFTLMKLKRVEMDQTYLYATNYFKTVRYTWDSIERITELDLSIFPLVRVHLKEKGLFGKRLSFIASRKRLRQFLDANPTAKKLVE